MAAAAARAGIAIGADARQELGPPAQAAPLALALIPMHMRIVWVGISI